MLKMELGEQADILYHLLTEQMAKAEIERYKDCFQPKNNEKPCSSQKDQVEEDAKAFREVATAFQLGLSFGFMNGLKANDKPQKISDRNLKMRHDIYEEEKRRTEGSDNE